jgi:hypothetical protein
MKSREREEAFCEYFGEQMALPVAELAFVEEANTEIIAQLMAQYTVNPDTVIRQLMKIGRLPRRVALYTSWGESKNPKFNQRIFRKIICADCFSGRPHSSEIDMWQMPIINCSDIAWAKIVSTNNCDIANRED